MRRHRTHTPTGIQINGSNPKEVAQNFGAQPVDIEPFWVDSRLPYNSLPFAPGVTRGRKLSPPGGHSLVLTPAIGKNFQAFNYLYPIPQGEIDKSGGSITQNPGY